MLYVCKGTAFNSKFLAFALKNSGAGGKGGLLFDGISSSECSCSEWLTIIARMLNLSAHNA